MYTFKRLAAVVILSCVCATATAGYGFEPVVEVPDTDWTRELAVGDVSGDGRDDLVRIKTAGDPSSDTVAIHAQTAAGTLAPPVTVPYDAPDYEYPAQMRLADFDGDGLQDIFIAHGPDLKLLRNQGNLQFSLSILWESFFVPDFIDFMDVDVDGNLDIVTWSIFYGDGEGGIRERGSLPGPGGHSQQLVDVNHDGRRDYAYVWEWEGQGRAYVHLHDGSGFSDEYAAIPLPMGRFREISEAVFADFDGDARPEVAALSRYYRLGIGIFEQPREGSRTLPTFLKSTGAYFGLIRDDIDGDGWVDLIQIEELVLFEGTVNLFLGSAAGFQPETSFYVGDAGSAVIGDINGDGLKDIVMGRFERGVAYMLGRASPMEADLGVYLGLSDSAVAVRVDNHSQETEHEAFDLVLELDARFGGISIDSRPAGCIPSPPRAGHDVTLRCAMGAIGPGAHRTLVVPITMPPRSTTNQLTAHAFLQISDDLRDGNNVAHKRLTIYPAGKKSGR
jgi:hypothetical protein